MAACEPCSFSDSTSSWSIKMQIKNLANIWPIWPHTWSITHTYCDLTKLSYLYKIVCSLSVFHSSKGIAVISGYSLFTLHTTEKYGKTSSMKYFFLITITILLFLSQEKIMLFMFKWKVAQAMKFNQIISSW